MLAGTAAEAEAAAKPDALVAEALAHLVDRVLDGAASALPVVKQLEGRGRLRGRQITHADADQAKAPVRLAGDLAIQQRPGDPTATLGHLPARTPLPPPRH